MYNGSRIYSGFQRGDIEYDISRIMVNMISNFAAKGYEEKNDNRIKQF